VFEIAIQTALAHKGVAVVAIPGDISLSRKQSTASRAPPSRRAIPR
jgi:thiamine pyrophosphate-dependent acetolactate synthase large subunit-like protein